MSDELDKDKLDQLDSGSQDVPATPAVDPWATAFATLEEPPAVDAVDAASVASVDDPGTPGATPGTDGVAVPSDAPVGAGDAGGPVPATGEPGEEDGAGDLGDIPATIERYAAEVEQSAIRDTAQMFLDRTDDKGNKLIRQTNGQLGATLNDSDIYRVDKSTGAAAFYNPDTGKPFTGDNPRAQAKAWVEGYNDELRETFNRLAEARKNELETQLSPVVELLKFTPTYEKLDATRQKMLDALIEDYEVYDQAGNHVGYSVDLNAALARVNKQISSIKAGRGAVDAPKPPTGPAVDMPTTGGNGTGKRTEFKSLAEAMEAEQNAQLDKLNKR